MHCFVLDVNLIQYDNPNGARSDKQCCDVSAKTGQCLPPCDLCIMMCLRVGGHIADTSNGDCDWKSVSPSVVLTKAISADFIIFNDTIGGVSNPIIFTFKELPEVWMLHDSVSQVMSLSSIGH